MSKILSFQSLLWAALIMALIGSVNHLAFVFASVDGNIITGWIQALAIDTGLIAIAYAIRQRKATRRPTRAMWALLALFTLISIFGNYLYAYLHMGDVWQALPAAFQALIPIMLAASLPILVFGLMEVLSDDVQYQLKQEARQSKKQQQNDQIADNSMQSANNARQEQIAARRNRVQQLHGEGLQPTAILEAIGQEYGVKDVRTIKADLQALNGVGAK